MALPQLTPEQRAAALEKAAAARKVRAELKERLKRGGTDLKQVLKDAETDEILGFARSTAQGRQGQGPGIDDRTGDRTLAASSRSG